MSDGVISLLQNPSVTPYLIWSKNRKKTEILLIWPLVTFLALSLLTIFLLVSHSSEYTKNPPPSRPLHLLFNLPRMLLPSEVYEDYSLTSTKSSPKWRLFPEVWPDPCFLCSFPYALNFLHSFVTFYLLLPESPFLSPEYEHHVGRDVFYLLYSLSCSQHLEEHLTHSKYKILVELKP